MLLKELKIQIGLSISLSAFSRLVFVVLKVLDMLFVAISPQERFMKISNLAYFLIKVVLWIAKSFNISQSQELVQELD